MNFLQTYTQLDDIADEAFIYYRIEVFDENNRFQGGLFRGTNKLLKMLWEIDDEHYDYINEALYWLEIATPYPDGLNDPKIKFAYKTKFYTEYIEKIKDLEAELSEVGWSIKINKIERPLEVLYEDETQIAYIA